MALSKLKGVRSIDTSDFWSIYTINSQYVLPYIGQTKYTLKFEVRKEYTLCFEYRNQQISHYKILKYFHSRKYLHFTFCTNRNLDTVEARQH